MTPNPRNGEKEMNENINNDLWKNAPIILFLAGLLSTHSPYSDMLPEEVWKEILIMWNETHEPTTANN